MLRSFPTFGCNWTETGSNIDPTEYVPSLNRGKKWSSPSNRDLKTGDFAWIVEPASPRAYYPLTRIVKLNFGSEPIVCLAEVRTASGNLIRTVVKFARVLRVSDSDLKNVLINVNFLSKLAQLSILVMRTFALIVSVILHVNPKTKLVFLMCFHSFC